MALIRDKSKAQLAFQVEGGGLDQFLVVRYRGSEGLCQLYRFEIELTSSEEGVAFNDVVGKPAGTIPDFHRFNRVKPLLRGRRFIWRRPGSRFRDFRLAGACPGNRHVRNRENQHLCL